MNEYSVLIFDADETLFDYRRGEAYALERCLDEAGIGFQSSHIGIYGEINRELWREYERGNVSREALRHERFTRFMSAIGKGEKDGGVIGKRYLEHLGNAGFMIPGAMELLEALSPRYRLALLTNGFSKVQRSRIDKTGTGRYFDAIVISEETGYQKPQPQIFNLVLDNLGHENRRDVLMIGDSLASDISGAAGAGIDTCWYNPDGNAAKGSPKPTFIIQRLGELRRILY